MDFATWRRRHWHRLPPGLRSVLRLLWGAVQRWTGAYGPQLGASIAFYTVFSMAPLLVVAIAIVGAVFGQNAARGQIVGEIQDVVGVPAAQAIQGMIEAAWREPGGGLAAVMAMGTLLVGATGVFAELKRALNAIGHITPRHTGVSGIVRARLTGFGLLLGFGFLLVASLLVSAVLAGLLAALSARYPGLAVLARVSELALSFVVLSLGFGAILRWLPDEPPSRRGLLLSACVSAGLFVVGKTFIGMYLGRASVSSSYGAAGSLVVVMLWVYYTSQILLFGAAVGREWDARRGKAAAAEPPAPARDAAGAAPAASAPGARRLHGQPGTRGRLPSSTAERARRH
ncbi:YihY/virulence factor BrkB family protein [Azohydromonas aeria]|uniref:YihY/virulence factor BrkB family protein n=1 Tax=Azohydromonas aeria TaxID=2590212 RepID=UPI0012F7CFE5|nr:YihY/virulence factor BrkB family protein [Azohydromonas aeria]